MLIWEFKHNLMPRFEDHLNSGIELATTISALAKHCLLIYEQMLATNRIKDKIHPSQSAENPFPIHSSTRFYPMLVTNIRTNTSFSSLSNSIIGTLISTP